jgi:hypothetical protein
MFNLLEKIIKTKSLLSFLILFVLKKLPIKFFSCGTIVKLKISKRPEYAYCMYYSAILAKKLNYKKISFIEFGVAGGNGLAFIEKFSRKISNELNIKIEIYGFTSKNGMPKPKDYKDLPYWFKENLYPTNTKIVKNLLSESKLIYGDVKKTTRDFVKKYNPAPIAAIFNDLDYYYSTINSFNIFKASSRFFLPRVFCYFDDIVGTENEMYNNYTGELLAIKNFNKNNRYKKISINCNLVANSFDLWRFQIYYYHNFKHPNYNKYISNNEQKNMNADLIFKY